MADSTTNLEQIETSQAQKEVTANQLFDALSPAAIYGRHAEACSGLVWGYYGGRFGGTSIDNGTITLDPLTDNYLVAKRTTGVVYLAHGSPGLWADTTTYARLYKINTGAATVSSYEDHRAGSGGVFGASASPLDDGDKGDIVVSGSGATWTVDNNVVSYAKMQDVSATKRVIGRNTSGSGDPEEVTLSQLLDWIGSAAQGDILYRDASGWARLAAGTSGYFLKANGAGANPSWAAPGSSGRHAVPVMASAMLPSATGGCAAIASVATSANKPDLLTLDFDKDTEEYAQFAIPMPKSWDEGTVTFKALWSHASTTTNFGVVWGLQAAAVSDGDAIAATFGTAQTSTDTGGTTDTLYMSPESSAITVNGTPAAEDLVYFRIYRKSADGSDTLAVDARLHGIVLYITTDAANDA